MLCVQLAAARKRNDRKVGRQIRRKIGMHEGPRRRTKRLAATRQAVHEAIDHVAADMRDDLGAAAGRLERMADDHGSADPQRYKHFRNPPECLIKAQQDVVGCARAGVPWPWRGGRT